MRTLTGIQTEGIDQIRTWLEELSRFNATPGLGITRILFTPEEVQGREYLKDEMRKLGLRVEEDPIGNIYGIFEGAEPQLGQIWTGSHGDSVPNAGMFDGTAGIIGGLEAVRLMKLAGFRPKRSIVVVVYTSEEPTRFGTGCLGSRALAGKLSLEDARVLKDAEGNTLYDVLASLGFCPERFDEVQERAGKLFAAVELHIEQSKYLDGEGIPLGIVETICAPSNFEVEVNGCQSHAGATSMEDRTDAFTACAEIALELERLARQAPKEWGYITATVGKVQVFPNASNVIPGKAVFSIDIRGSVYEGKQALIAEMKAMIEKLAEYRGVSASVTEINNDYPVHSDKQIIALLEASCSMRGLAYKTLISGAFHDSMMIGLFAPVAMLFVPSKNGISHNPEEWTDYEDIEAGVAVLADTLMALSLQ